MWFPDGASNGIEFSGERKRVRCNEGLGTSKCRLRTRYRAAENDLMRVHLLNSALD
jgi:hypothetical protein